MRRVLGGVGAAALLLAGCESAPPARSEAPPPAAAAQVAPAPSPPAPAPAPASAAPAPPPGPPAGQESAAQARPASKAAVIKTAQANFRAGPGTSAKIVAVLRKGTRVEVLEERDHWYRVKLADGREGWIAESVAAPSE